MIQHCVERLPGCCDIIDAGLELGECRVADEISDNLIKTVLAASSVGRAYLEKNGYDWDTNQATTSLYECVIPKSVVEVVDKRNGTYRARVSKFSIRITEAPGNSFQARSIFELKKPK